MLVLVEGESDAGAVRALAELVGFDLTVRGITVLPASGVTNFAKRLAEFTHGHPGERVCGLYDAADERHVRRALAQAGLPVAREESPESLSFFACEADLEDELIRAVGVEAVLEVIECEGELASFRRFQAMPEHRAKTMHAQLHRFLGTRATRKIRAARRIAERLNPDQLPPPLANLAIALVRGAPPFPASGDA